jgi:NADPH-dependent curcumin reductase CurA
LNHQIVLAEAPSGTLGVHHFKWVTTEVPQLTSDQVLIRVICAQIPPAARALMTNTTAFPLTRPGEGIFTAVVGEVVEGPAAGPAPGTIVTCFAGWEDYSVVPVSQVRPVTGMSFFHWPPIAAAQVMTCSVSSGQIPICSSMTSSSPQS